MFLPFSLIMFIASETRPTQVFVEYETGPGALALTFVAIGDDRDCDGLLPDFLLLKLQHLPLVLLL